MAPRLGAARRRVRLRHATFDRDLFALGPVHPWPSGFLHLGFYLRGRADPHTVGVIHKFTRRSTSIRRTRRDRAADAPCDLADSWNSFSHRSALRVYQAGVVNSNVAMESNAADHARDGFVLLNARRGSNRRLPRTPLVGLARGIDRRDRLARANNSRGVSAPR